MNEVQSSIGCNHNYLRQEVRAMSTMIQVVRVMREEAPKTVELFIDWLQKQLKKVPGGVS